MASRRSSSLLNAARLSPTIAPHILRSPLEMRFCENSVMLVHSTVATAIVTLCNNQLNKNYAKNMFGNKNATSGESENFFQRNLSCVHFPRLSWIPQRCYSSCTESNLGGSQADSFSPLNPNHSVVPDDSNTNDVAAAMIQEILKSHENISDLERVLDECSPVPDEDLVMRVLRRHHSDWKPALSFFNWANGHRAYSHGSKPYNEMLDILGRMKQIKLMRQFFDEIPEEKRASVVNRRTFAVLMNRYSGAHKVQEAIDVFYKMKDYGLDLDVSAFHTLLMSLCRYKHIEEAESLFINKHDEFPPVLKSRNIILNGWCVLGNLHEAKRFWNDIITSGCKPDLFTYGTFINSLTKNGNLGTAVKLFTTMWEKGCPPDVAICNCIIDALCFKKKIPEALKIFGEMDERGCLPDVATYNSLIKHLCNIGRMEKVYELLDEMEQKGIAPNSRTYSYVLKTTKTPDEVGELLGRMERGGCRIDGDTYNLILGLYVRWSYATGVRSLWSEMERSSFGLDQRSYTIMIHGLHSEGRLDEALQYYDRMKSKGMTPEPRTRILVKAIYLKREQVNDPMAQDSSIVAKKKRIKRRG